MGLHAPSYELRPGEQCFAVLQQLLSEADTHEMLLMSSHTAGLLWHLLKRRRSSAANGRAKTQTLCVLANSYHSSGRGGFSFSPVMHSQLLQTQSHYEHGPTDRTHGITVLELATWPVFRRLFKLLDLRPI